MASLPAFPVRRRRSLLSNVGLMFVASIVLSCASYYTTYLGMVQYVTEADWLLAAAITFGIQAFMFTTAWIASQSLGTSVWTFLLSLLVYVICASVSVFFSFSSLFNSIFDANQRDQVNSTYMRSFYQETAAGLQQELDAAVAAGHQRIMQGVAYAEWARNVDHVIDLQRSAPDLLRARFEAEREKRAQDLAALSAELAVLQAREGQLQAEAERLGAELGALEARVGGALARLDEVRAAAADLRNRISVLEAQMEAERSGVGSKAGEGPKFRALRDQRDAMQRELIPLDAEIANAGAPDAGRQERQDILDRQQTVTAELAKVVAQVKVLADRQVRLQASVDEESATVSPDVDQAIADMETAFRNAAAAPEEFAAEAVFISSTCGRILDGLRSDPQLADRTAGMTCGIGRLQADVNALSAALTARSDFAGTCDASRLMTIPDGQAFKVLAAETEACFVAAGVQQSERRDELARLLTVRGPTAHPFVVAQTALFEDRLPVAYMAGIIAVVIDLLILMVALMAQLVESSREEKAIRALQDVRFEGEGASRLAFVEILPGTHNFGERKKLAGELVALNLAYFDDARNRLYLGRDGREYLNRRLAGS